jgi:hypothetical protein
VDARLSQNVPTYPAGQAQIMISDDESEPSPEEELLSSLIPVRRGQEPPFKHGQCVDVVNGVVDGLRLDAVVDDVAICSHKSPKYPFRQAHTKPLALSSPLWLVSSMQTP